MSGGALAFFLLSWIFVLGLAVWSFSKILTAKRHFDPDGIGPAGPAEPSRVRDALPPHASESA